MKKVFIDTNILIDFLSHREHFFDEAALIFQLGRRRKVCLLVSSLSFATASFILEAHYKLPLNTVTKLFKDIIGMCYITPVDNRTVVDAVSSAFNDIEDAMQYFSALREQADIIITRNPQDFRKSKIPVLSPTEFLVPTSID